MKDERILITGGAGSIGGELTRQLSRFNSVYILDTNETAFFDLHEELRQKGFDVQGRIGDVRSKETLKDIFHSFNPTAVFHCAALKHVTPNEWHPEEAIQTNSLGTLNVVEQAKKHGIKVLVNISTDKVINSNSVMGVTKRLGEIIVKNAGYVSVRFGNVLGSRGSVIPIWQRQLEKDEPLTVTDPGAHRFFMTIEHACMLLIEAARSPGGTILIMDMGESVNILELAKDILGKAGKPDHPIEIIGMRPGETLHEELMTPGEKLTAVKMGAFWQI